MKYNIYLITDSKYNDERCISALKAGVDVIQLREKDISSKDFYEKALYYKKLCKKYNSKLIINDRVDIALAVDADGLHVGQSDLDISICKNIFPNKIIGVSATNYEEAIVAYKSGASYVGIGAMFPTITKSDAKYVSLETLEKIVRDIDIPVVCIGGITVSNANKLLEYNIDGLAICSEILASDNPGQKVLKFKSLYKKTS